MIKKLILWSLAITAFLLVLSLVFLTFLFSRVLNEENLEFIYALNEDGKSYTVTVSHRNIKEIEIPAVYNGKPVTKIGERGLGDGPFGKGLEVVILPPTIKEIGDYAFEGLSKLKHVEIPEGVEKIGKYAFSECGIESIILPGTVIDIGDNVFYKCSKLKSVVISEGISKLGKGMFSSSSVETVELPRKLLIIGEAAFSGCSNLKNINIPNDVNIIHNNVFSGCGNLKSIIIPKSVGYIGKAFDNCDKLLIYCEGDTEGKEWENEWNCERPVKWGYTEKK